jgi:hypothetical protein
MAAQLVHDLAVRPTRETFLRERSPQAVAAEALQRLAAVRRHALPCVEREAAAPSKGGHRSGQRGGGWRATTGRKGNLREEHPLITISAQRAKGRFPARGFPLSRDSVDR